MSMHSSTMSNATKAACPAAVCSYPWIPDTGDNTYRNPIIHADYSDPDVIRHGEDFWMIASSFNCTPGLPVLHSKDLVNWTLVTHAIQQVPHPSYRHVRAGCGVWAPSIRFHAGKFWIVFPMPDEGIYVTNADHPAGPWAEPWCLAEAKGWIDPCPFWDDDGRAYLAVAFAMSRAGKKERIHLFPMTQDCRQLLGEGRELFHTPHHLYLEGPKLHKMNGWYYIFAPGGGVQTGWQVVFRSRQIEGPYEEKVVLEQGSTPINGPHQGALVDTSDGRWWFVHFQDAGPFGRITHLQPVRWENDWPVMGVDYDGNGVGEPVPSWEKPVATPSSKVSVPATTDEFDHATLGLQWQWQANHDPGWISLRARPGWLRLFSADRSDLNLNLLPQYLSQKFPARGFVAETLVDNASTSPGLLAGLAIVGGGKHAAVAVRRTVGENEIVVLQHGLVEAIHRFDAQTIRLRVHVNERAECRFSYALSDGQWIDLDRVFQTTEGGWIGAKVGPFAMAAGPAMDSAPQAFVDFDYLRFSSP